MAEPPLRLAVLAMACRYEVVVTGADRLLARAAGEAALREIERLDATLSPFQPGSEISALNGLAGTRPVRVTPEVAQLLTRCAALHQLTGGAFDPTVGPLLTAWGFRGQAPLRDPAALARVREAVGLHLVEVDEETPAVRFTHPGVRLDLGAVGKGYAVDRACAGLAEHGCGGLVHAGTSSIRVVGPAPDGGSWPVALPTGGGTAATVVHLRDAALSVSGRQGRTVAVGDVLVSHIVDPRTGEPVTGPELAAAITADATTGDALTTALLVAGEALLPTLEAALPNARLVLRWPDREATVGAWGGATP